MRRVSSDRVGIGGVLSIVLVLGLSGCASMSSPATPAAVVVPPPSIDTKVAWILRLEQQRILRDERPPDPGSVGVIDAGDASPVSEPPVAAGFQPALTPDLAMLVNDPEASIRERAALAIGRVGMEEGKALLIAALADPVEGVRGSAAFALGLMGDASALPVLLPVLADSSLPVRGRVVEALGLIGEPSAGPAIVQATTDCPAWLASVPADDEEWPKGPELELCRLALYALVRVDDFESLSRLALDPAGRPVSSWWPVAYALQRIEDPRALPALRTLASSAGTYSVAFALRGLAALGDEEALPIARRLAGDRDVDVKLRVAGVRLIGRVGAASDTTVLTDLLLDEPAASALAIEATMALGDLGTPEAFDFLLDGIGARAPAMRAASLAAAARTNPEAFILVLSGLSRDPDWRVRAALAGVLGTLPADRVTPAVVDLSADEDPRVHSAALRALAVLKVPDLADRLRVSLQAEDFAERATAAELMGELKAEGGASLLDAAYTRGETDSTHVARLAAVEAVAEYGDDGVATLSRALADRDWAVRVRAAALLRGMDVVDAELQRPAPLRHAPAFFESDALLHPRYSPRVFMETQRGIIEMQLDVVAAPLTVATFIEQVRSGMFNGLRVHRLIPGFVIQTGDPREDGMGGPGYTQRDELSPVPYLRGSVGMALAGPETAGSQWFITTTPQPHLDGRYTLFGRVVGGWDVLDRMAPGDLVERVRIWDGVELR